MVGSLLLQTFKTGDIRLRVLQTVFVAASMFLREKHSRTSWLWDKPDV